MEQLIAHGIGDYIFQSTWMALNKNKVSWICALHCFTYTLCFLPLTQSWAALLAIFASHFVLDRFGLARFVVWLKEGQRPGGLFPWSWSSMSGYYDMEKVTENIQGIQKANQEEKLKHLMDYAQATFNDPAINRPIWIRIWLTIIADNVLHLLCNALAIAYF